MTAVIVEDEVRIREGICKLLGKIFPEITVSAMAENGLEGLAFIEYYKPDLVITDIRMPGLDGLEMLTKAQALNLFPKVIVLTAYSEFSYAQQAVRLGVTDYLVKPIVVQEFTQTVRKVQSIWEQEQKRAPETIANAQNIISRLLHSDDALEPDMELFLEKRYRLWPDEPILLLPVCLGEGFSGLRGPTRRELENILGQWEGLRFSVVDIEYDRTVLALAFGYGSRERFEAWYASHVRWQNGKGDAEAACGIIEAPGLGRIREFYRTLMDYLDWMIPLGEGALISYPRIAQTRTEVCVYPMDLESQMKTSLCAGDIPHVRKAAAQFHRYFTSTVYAPGEIKESYIRFLWAFLNVAKEVGILDSREIDQRELLDQVMEAKTAGQLLKPFEFLFSRMRTAAPDTGGTSLAVKKAQSMIHEFYADGITLGEIANRLNMSQEYLGAQFHKEVGEPFSVYIRNIRMAKAKELLIGTQLKQYEIARRVGYSDPKYFARVFRECEGTTPAEYRKTYR